MIRRFFQAGFLLTALFLSSGLAFGQSISTDQNLTGLNSQTLVQPSSTMDSLPELQQLQAVVSMPGSHGYSFTD